MKKLSLMGIIGIGLMFLFPSCSPYYYQGYGYRPAPRYHAAPPPPLRYYATPPPYRNGRHHHRRRY